MPKNRKRFRSKKKQGPEDNPNNSGGFFGDRKRRERSPEEIREHLKLLGFLVTWIIFLSAVYMLCIELEFRPVMPIYTGLGAALFIVWLVFNGGFKKTDVEKIEKPEETSYEEFTAFINKLKGRQRKAKYLLVLFIPFPMIMLVDHMIIVWGERLMS